MRISIITVCFNSEKTIRNTIESVLSQDYTLIEYIIIDGDSKDNTIKIINEYKDKVSIFISEPDLGIYDAMTKGIKASTGDVIGFLNSDDFFEYNGVITDILNQFKSSPKSSLVFGDVVFVDPLNTDKIIRYYCSKKFTPWKLRFGWMPPHPSSFFKRYVYEQLGYFSRDYKIAADYDFFVRALLVHKLAFTRVNKVLVRMRAGGLSTSGLRSSMLLNSEIVNACKSNNVYTNLFFVLLKIPFKFIELYKRPKK